MKFINNKPLCVCKAGILGTFLLPCPKADIHTRAQTRPLHTTKCPPSERHMAEEDAFAEFESSTSSFLEQHIYT